MKKLKLAFLVLIFAILAMFVFLSAAPADGVKSFLASLVFPESVAPEDLKRYYSSYRPIRVLVVPGHDNEYTGTSFDGIKESDLTFEAAEKLFNIFKKDHRFEVFLSRNENGYMPAIKSYFTSRRDELRNFRDVLRSAFSNLLRIGSIQRYKSVSHNNVSEESSLRLYAINKWANDNDIDLVIHIHFNDVPRPSWLKGEYSGFAIYIPESQLPNYRASYEIAESVRLSLSKYFRPSDYPPEKDGLVEDQTLIAVGSNASLHSASLLIEYGYIYESQISSPIVGPAIASELVQQTYNGVKNYFEGGAVFGDSAILLHKWESDLRIGSREDNIDVLALQIALAEEALYPPANFNKNDCPITGKFLSCTHTSVVEFQKKYNLPPTGFVGPMTRNVLNLLYSSP